MTLLDDGSYLRITAEQDVHAPAPPLYTLCGTRFSPQRSVPEFRWILPTKVVGDTYAHPEQLGIIELDSGYLLLWTDLGHTLGNAIQALRFDAQGVAAREAITLITAHAESHVEHASMVRAPSGTMLLAWSQDEGDGYSLKAQSFSEALMPVSSTHTIAPGPIDDGGRIIADHQGDPLALWHTNGAIYVKAIPQA